MPDPKTTITIEAINKASKELNAIAKELANMAKAAQDPNAKVTKGVDKTTEALGMSRREWMRTGNEATFYLTAIASKSGEAGKQLSQLTGMATQLGESFMFGGGVGVGIAAAGVAISFVADQIQKQKEMEEAAIKPSKDLDAAIVSLTESHDALGKVIATVFNLTGKEADIIAQAAKNYTELNGPMKQVEVQREHLATLTREWSANEQLISAAQFQLATGELTETKVLDDLIANRARLDALMRAAGATYTTLSQDVLRQAEALNEEKRITDLLTTNIPRMADAWRDYQSRLKELAATHEDTMAKLAKQGPDAEAKAAKDRLRIIADAEENTAKLREDGARRVVELQEDLNRRLNELDANFIKASQERAYDHANRLKELDRDMAQSKEDYARDVAKIEQDLAKELEGIQSDSLEDELGAKTWGEVQKIRRDKERRLKDAQDKAAQAKKELEEKKKRDDEEFEHKRALMEEEFQHQKELAEQELKEQKERARQEAERQIAEQRRSTEESIRQAERNRDKQVTAVNERLAEEKKAIGERQAEEEKAYGKAKQAALDNYNSQMKALSDTRTEVQRLADDWLSVKNNIDASTKALIDQSNLKLPSWSGSWGSWSKPSKTEWYGSGLDAIVTKPTVIGVGEKGAEHITVTPAGKSTGGITVNINAPIYGVMDLQRTIQQALYRHDGLNG